MKYLEFTGNERRVRLLLRGKGVMQIQTEQENVIAQIEINDNRWKECYGELSKIKGIHKIGFTVKKGFIDFSEFEFLL